MTESKKKEYLATLFKLVRLQSDMTAVNDKKCRFNGTELRLLGELLTAKYEGKQLISTRLAEKLGITRSAVSQIVQKLEKEGVICRRACDTDKKIAFVEISDSVLQAYKEDLQAWHNYVGELVEEFGESNFYQMCTLIERFAQLAQSKRLAIKQKLESKS